MRILAPIMVLGLFFVAQPTQAQKGKTEPASATSASTTRSAYDIEEGIFREALQFNDAFVARVALFRMIALKPEATYLYDTLMYLYFSTGQFNESLTLAERIYSKDNFKMAALEVKAVSQQSLGLLKEALNDFETLNAKNKNVKYLYQIASLQYDLKRVAECSGSINQILTMEGIEKETVPFFAQDRSRQEIPIKAAALNMRGVLAGELGENEVAIKAYEEAVKLAPDFALAKNNLEVMKKRKEAAAKPNEASKTTPAKK